jgi:hypothetical protein
MPRIKRPEIGSLTSSIPPGVRSFASDLLDYSYRKKRVYAAYTIITICRFGRWLSWAFFPRYRFFPGLTESVDGAMSWEMKARISLRPDPKLPFILAATGAMGAIIASRSFRVKKGA